ncbi:MULTISPECIES: M20/M25/M40 family metallo-hydrolase [unclassified Streptomyces]|uniref:M20/M25/M40 family metallo-hydrolase n=1 Tax=Streptomyces sp. NBC_00060 TaxID=2975636 RepID=A0AAU2H9S9_9ACTN
MVAALALVAALLPADAEPAAARTTASLAEYAQGSGAPTVSQAEVMPHLRALQRITDRNGGNRAHGTRGYAQSVAYVRHALERVGFRTQLRHFSHADADGYNLIADWPGGDPQHVLLTGAHLDSVPAGPGINDNGSGSAAVLAAALKVAESRLKPARHLRFAWWGAEEAGLIGSAHYVQSLSPSDHKAIDLYLNLDQAGSKNTRQWFVVNDAQHGESAGFQAFQAWFAALGLATFDVGVGGSDHEPFGIAGIPSSGLSTGISDCIHNACDTLANVDPPTPPPQYIADWMMRQKSWDGTVEALRLGYLAVRVDRGAGPKLFDRVGICSSTCRARVRAYIVFQPT